MTKQILSARDTIARLEQEKADLERGWSDEQRMWLRDIDSLRAKLETARKALQRIAGNEIGFVAGNVASEALKKIS